MAKFGEGGTYGDLFTAALQNFGVLCIGLYRLLLFYIDYLSYKCSKCIFNFRINVYTYTVLKYNLKLIDFNLVKLQRNVLINYPLSIQNEPFISFMIRVLLLGYKEIYNLDTSIIIGFFLLKVK